MCVTYTVLDTYIKELLALSNQSTLSNKANNNLK